MALRIATNQTTSGVTYDLGALDSLYVPVGVSSISSSNNAATGTGGGHRVQVSGSLFGAQVGIKLGSAVSDTGNSVWVSASGSVEGFGTGILMQAANGRIFNYGTISSPAIAINVSGTLSTTESIAIINYGRIAGGNGIFTGSGTAIVNNFGSITSNPGTSDKAIYTDRGDDIIRNRGTITGNIDTYIGNDKLYNRATILGDIATFEGSDLLDNRGGLVDGKIDMGAGDDTFKPGSNADDATGGAGFDTLDFTAGGSLKLALDGSFAATGLAAGDSYTEFEFVLGSKTGTNVLTGDGLVNSLTGGDNKDTLSGLAGNDILFGGQGDDILLGGSDNDDLRGSSGADQLTGGSGRDLLTGGSGADLFIFGPGDFSGVTRATTDTIFDFSQSQKDKINLAAVDAKSGTPANEAFSFIGTAAFSNVAGELRYTTAISLGNSSNDALVQGDTNGDGIADFAFVILGQPVLVAADFVL